MLDSIKGGKAGAGLFDGSVDPQNTEKCLEKCPKECPTNSVGIVTGSKNGLNFPDPTTPITPSKP